MDKEQLPSPVEKDSAINRLLEAFERARKVAHFPTNKKCFDEDVNIYISHLLFAVAMPNYTYITEQYISLDPADVRLLIEMAEDNYLKYFIYKVNGDNLLLQVGLFQGFKTVVELTQKNSGRAEVADYLKLAQHYYQEAAACNRKIHKKKTALSEVLLKLAKNLENYTKALGQMRRDFYLFYDFYEDENFRHFSEDVDAYERQLNFEAKQDVFLDLYSRWLVNPCDGQLKSKINLICAELHELKASFSFYLE